MRIIGKLKPLNVERMKQPGLHADGGGLWLQVRSATSKSWLFRYFIGDHDPVTGEPVRDPVTGRIKGRTREAGLGSFANVPLKEARELAANYRRLRAQGVDPLEQREELRRQAALDKAKALTFRQCAEAYIASHRKGWRSEKHAQQWTTSLATYAYPVIGDLPVQAVDTQLVMRAIEQLWMEKPPTANRVRAQVEAILDWAKVRGYREGENPARWRGHLSNLLPKRSKVRPVKHYAALPYGEIPAFMAKLRTQEGVAARALEFCVLTAARIGEAVGAQRSEIDLAGKLWMVPAERMKAHREHRVPLSRRAMAIVAERLAANNDDFVFPGARGADALTQRTVSRLLATMRRGDATLHGMRSAFRQWAAEQTNVSREIAELALAHVTGSAVERAYQRSDLLEPRRLLMDRWSAYCEQSPTTMGEIIPLNAGRAAISP